MFDIQTPEGQRIRGGVRSIQLTDIATGKSLVLATVKGVVPGEIVPPNQVVYRSGFDGLDADVLLVWRHDSISQNVVLKERPALPAGLNPATTRLEVVSELIESPVPVLNQAVLNEPGKPEMPDDVTIGFGSLLALRGKAFAVSGENALALGGDRLADDHAVSVAKEFRQLDDGRRFIIESVGWTEIQTLLEALPSAARADNSQHSEKQATDSRVWPKRVAATRKQEPMQVAALPYKNTGFLVDLDFRVSVSDFTFLSGSTYYFPTNFSVGPGTAVFQPGCVIKYASNIYLLLSGEINCPASGQLMPVFTSKDDDLFGDVLPDSTHNPTYAASPAIWVYFQNFSTLIEDMRIRWATTAVRYDAPSLISHTIQNCKLQQCQTGLYANNAAVTILNVTKCGVTTPTAPPAYPYYTGSMTDDCGPLYTVASFAGIKEDITLGVPCDTMGAVGPNHFIVLLNDAVAVYDKYTGVRLSPNPTRLNDFFTLTVIGGQYAGTYPTANSNDPRILYDQGSQRWIASALDLGSHHVLLAVSHTSDPIGAGGANWISNNWTKYLVTVGGSCDTDYDTLGVDSNGIYISAIISDRNCTGIAKVAALPKGPFIDGLAQQVQSNFILELPGGTPNIQPAVNFDPITTSDPAWFIYQSGATLFYNSLRWVGGFTQEPQWQYQPFWGELTVSASFYDLGNFGISAPELNGTNLVVLGQQGNRLMMAMVRKIGGTQYLWTSHNIGVNSAGNNDNGMADRSAVEWFKIQTSPTVMIADSDRIRDSAATNPKFYYMPSLVVNKNGDMVVGFSGSSVNDYISAYYTGKLNNGSSPTTPIRYYSGKDSFIAPPPGGIDWGDYSFTSLDPNGLTIWTIQEYAETKYSTSDINAYGTRICAITPF